MVAWFRLYSKSMQLMIHGLNSTELVHWHNIFQLLDTWKWWKFHSIIVNEDWKRSFKVHYGIYLTHINVEWKKLAIYAPQKFSSRFWQTCLWFKLILLSLLLLEKFINNKCTAHMQMQNMSFSRRTT